LNTGSDELAIVMDIEVVCPHWPLTGVNVYKTVPRVAVLIAAGDQFPTIPLLEIEGRGGGVESCTSGPIWEKAGTTFSKTRTVIVTGSADCPLAGVKV
jgi:hypothetical protein